MSPKISLSVTCLVAPLQIEGTVAGVEVYYRARHHRWSVELHGLSNDVLGAVADERRGECTGEEELSLAFAMSKIFAVQEVRDAVAAAEMAELDAAEDQAWEAWAGAGVRA